MKRANRSLRTASACRRTAITCGWRYMCGYRKPLIAASAACIVCEKPMTGVAGAAGSSSALAGRKRAQSPLALRHHILDEAGDDPPDQLVDAAGEIETRIARVDLAQQFVQERHLAQGLDVEKAGAQAVVDVMGIIGDVVGDRGRLRLAAGMGREFQVLQGVVFEDRKRHAPRRVAQGRLTLRGRAAGRCA